MLAAGTTDVTLIVVQCLRACMMHSPDAVASHWLTSLRQRMTPPARAPNPMHTPLLKGIDLKGLLNPNTARLRALGNLLLLIRSSSECL
jgi:hypothetical protein